MKLLSLALLCGVAAAQPSPRFDVTAYGARGDGKTNDAPAIQKAVDACAKAGGGTVYVAPGKYLAGAITLRSNVALDIEAGATILVSQDPKDFPLRPSPWNDRTRQISSFLYGEDLENVRIAGGGTINGQGAIWWKRQRLATPHQFHRAAHPPSLSLVEGLSLMGVPSADIRFTEHGPPPEQQSPADREEAAKLRYGRPHLIKLVRCRNVTIEGLTLIDSPSWNVNPVLCEFVNVHGLKIVSPSDSLNTDGVNPESCRNVHISDCHIDVGDDCITIKSGTDEAGRRVGRACENITVTNCTMIHGHGGFVVGSEMAGGARNLAVSNCVFRSTERGIRIKTQRGRGGVAEGIVANNIVMDEVTEAFSITTYYSGKDGVDRSEPVGEGTPVFRDFHFSNIMVRASVTAGEILGLREMPISGLTFDNVRIAAGTGLTCYMVKDSTFRNVRIDTREGPALACRDAAGLEIDGFRTLAPHADAPVIDLNQAKDVFLRGSWAAAGAGPFLLIRGAETAGIRLGDNDLSRAGQAVATAGGARREAVSQE